ncbi:MAG: glycosyltransferase [Bacteroidia bacterium]|nr:glycosyltransferase [Bacteroidia bacterium]
MVLFIIYTLLGLYLALSIIGAIGFFLTKDSNPTDSLPDVKISIIVCARNEEKNITYCLQSIMAQKYEPDNFELILVDDNSYDNTVNIARNVLKNARFKYKILSNEKHHGKKQSIRRAVSEANHPLIVTRDADTFTVSTGWLQSIAEHHQKTKADFIIAPISIANYSGLMWALQAVENNVLSLFSAGSSFYNKAFLCSGANLVFTKEIFEKTGAYASHLEIQSGDDVLFLEDVKKIKGKISFLKSKSAIVLTYPSLNFSDLIKQKVRWASKFKVNSNFFNVLAAALVFLVNVSFLFAMAALPFVPVKLSLQLFVFLKLSIDILLLFLASTFIKNKNLLWYGLPVAIVYPVYACVVGIASLVMKPKWK